MKHFRKSFLTLLALTLFGGMGAWAQDPKNVTQVTADMLPASWANNNDDGITMEDLQAWGFEAVDASVAQAWTGAPSGEAYLFYAFENGNFYYVYYENGHREYDDVFYSTKGDFYLNVTQYQSQYFYTSAAQEIKLTPDATGKVWTLAETPDYDLDLKVVYYQKYALKEIPANWQVKVDGVDKTAAIVGDSLKITETAQVLLTPDHPERVKKVILVDEAVLVNIDGITLDITGCTTWAQIIARNSGVIWEWNSRVRSNEGILSTGGINDWVSTSAPYNPAQQSVYHWEGI